MKDRYTSLELSKKLAEAGLEYHTGAIHLKYSSSKRYFLAVGQSEIHDYYLGKDKPTSFYFAFDILNDICCKYAKEFFGELETLVEEHSGAKSYMLGWVGFPQEILYLMQQGKKQDAEDYLWDNTIFNPKNRGYYDTI